MKVLKGIGYSRVSTHSQAFDEYGQRIKDGSLDSQRNRIVEYLERKSNHFDRYELIDFYEDAGISGKDTNRPQYQKMISLIASGTIDFIIATEISRLSRKTSHFMNLMELCSENNVDIYILKGDFHANSTQGKMMAMFYAMLSEIERETTVQRQSANIESRLKMGSRINGSVEILGLDRCPNRKEVYIVNEVERIVLIKILNLFLECDSKAEALRKVNKEGLLDKSKPFTRSRFDNLLFNIEWRYSGKWFLKDKKTKKVIQHVSLTHGEVVEESLRNKVLKKVKELQVMKKACGAPGYIYLLSGVLVDIDGNNFHGVKGKGQGGVYYYYYCSSTKKRIKAKELEKATLEYLFKLMHKSSYLKQLFDSSYRSIYKEIKSIEKDRQSLRLKKHSIEAQINKLGENLASENLSDTSIDLITSMIINKKDELLSISQQISVNDDKINSLNKIKATEEFELKLKEINKKILKLSRKEQKHIVRTLVDKIIVLNEFEIKIIFKKTSTTEVFLYVVVSYKLYCKNNDLNYQRSLYDKGYSVRAISKKLNVSRSVITKHLRESGVDEFVERTNKYNKSILKLVDKLRRKEYSYQEIARRLNLWRIPTRSKTGMWHAKTVREFLQFMD